jgi:hypothetical protein
LLEQLGNTDGHILNLNEKSTMLHLSAYCKIKQETLIEICNTLADLEAIDRDLWSHKYIFCEPFVAGIKDAYKKRIGILPSKPKHVFALKLEKEFPAVETSEKHVMAAGNCESESEKEKEKEKEKGENKDMSLSPLFQLWNDVMQEPKELVLNENEIKICEQRLIEKPLEEWREIFLKIKSTPFLCGQNNSGWRASLSWIVKDSINCMKVMNGNYDSKINSTSIGHSIIGNTHQTFAEIRTQKTIDAARAFAEEG